MNRLETLGVVAILLFARPAGADHDHHRERARNRLAPADAPAEYREECGACHLAFPPGLLPARSWSKLMSSLDDHFANNAELEPTATATITRFLLDNAAEARTHRRSKKALRGIEGTVPLRISELPYIRRKHREIRAEVWTRPSVTSRANCGACHSTAERWLWDDDRVKIPR